MQTSQKSLWPKTSLSSMEQEVYNIFGAILAAAKSSKFMCVLFTHLASFSQSHLC